ncbi:hypothetical protein PoB_001348100 [Plakobranchus ocellatus]|uniref:Uncharacterized protein n=1 Tax=Plakobranchus ocellatus TaxID=259542 RepID=A0AAV3YI78_9GAST|nr:hypothetical protein PoB_001348100 [Plakobranchus ocellatus]
MGSTFPDLETFTIIIIIIMNNDDDESRASCQSSQQTTAKGAEPESRRGVAGPARARAYLTTGEARERERGERSGACPRLHLASPRLAPSRGLTD